MEEKKGNGAVTVPPIKYGVVINHLPPEMAGYAHRILKLKGYERITLSNVSSTRYGRKDMIKVHLDDERFKAGDLEKLVALVRNNSGKLGLISPQITIYVIDDQTIKEKWHPELPDEIEGLVKCTNPICLTNSDRHAISQYQVVTRDPITIQCEHCERRMDHPQILENLV
jgi:aspartate carbamoyltransferase regulatory subunit